MPDSSRSRPADCARRLRRFAILVVFIGATLLIGSSGLAAFPSAIGITSIGTNVYPVTNKPVVGSQINWSRPLSAGLVSAVPVNEGTGTNFYDAVTQLTYTPKKLSGSPVNAQPPAWFTPSLSANYPWAGAAISNNGTNAQAIQAPFLQSDLITNVTAGYSYAVLVQSLDTTTFGRIMDATGAAVITIYLNTPGFPGQVATTWRNASGTAIVPRVPYTVNQWLLILCTVQQGLGVMYVNGVPAASDSNVNLARSWANQTGQLCYNSTGNGSILCNANFSSWWIWNNRVLTAPEAAQMYADPWVMFHSGAQKGFIKGTRVTLTNTAAVTNLNFYSHVAAGNIRLALYDNSAPKNLLWQSPILTNTAAGAWIGAPVASGTPGHLTLSSGTYWLAWQADTTCDVPSYTAGADGDGFSVSQGFGSFPGALSGGQSSSETWSIYFNAMPPLSITSTSPLADGTVGAAYSQTLAATGGAMPYTWSAVSGALPGGLALENAGVLSGTPTNAGTFNFTAQVMDNTGATATNVFSLNIADHPVPPGFFFASRISSGIFQMRFHGLGGQTYTVETSTNLVDWQVLGQANYLGGDVFEFSDAGADIWPIRFYRLMLP